MDLIVNGEKVAENPNRAQVRSALAPLLMNPRHKVELRRSDFDWIRATWSRSARIKLQCRRSREGSETLRDNALFVSLRRVVALFCSYARGFDGWHRMITWRPEGANCLKRAAERIVFVGRIAGIALSVLALPLILAGYTAPEKFEALNARPSLAGALLLLVGATGSLWTLPDFAYRHEMDEGPYKGSHQFLFSLYIGAVGLAVFLAGVLT